jgi:hypothetical protein
MERLNILIVDLSLASLIQSKVILTGTTVPCPESA